MLVVQTAARPRKRSSKKGRIGLAVAGGGPIGGMYELGTLRALDEVLDGIDLTRLDVYVGVSSGAFLAASLANGIGTTAMCRIFLTGENERPRTIEQHLSELRLRRDPDRLANEADAQQR